MSLCNSEIEVGPYPKIEVKIISELIINNKWRIIFVISHCHFYRNIAIFNFLIWSLQSYRFKDSLLHFFCSLYSYRSSHYRDRTSFRYHLWCFNSWKSDLNGVQFRTVILNQYVQQNRPKKAKRLRVTKFYDYMQTIEKS